MEDESVSCTASISSLSIRGFKTHLPIDDVKFFSTVAAIGNDSLEPPATHKQLIIGMAFYNEEPTELRRTLVSLADQVKELEETGLIKCKVVIVSDGHAQMHGDTKKYLKALFAGANGDDKQKINELYTNMDEYIETKKAADEDERNGVAMDQRKPQPEPLMFVIKKDNGRKVRIRGAIDENQNRHLDMTWIAKTLNKRKHNSQEWMFQYAKEMSAHIYDKRDVLIFLTDCGTLYEKGCLLRLVANMLDNPKCVGCTGRQRVMTAVDQDCADEGFLEQYFRLVQSYDYEATYCQSSGAFSLIGILPVLPGPCCMMRYSALVRQREFRPPDPLEDLLGMYYEFFFFLKFHIVF